MVARGANAGGGQLVKDEHLGISLVSVVVAAPWFDYSVTLKRGLQLTGISR
jgi:hypothetical protein